MTTPMAAIASLHNTGGNKQFLVFYNDNSNHQLIAVVWTYDELKSVSQQVPGPKKKQLQSDGDLGDEGIPSGNISSSSALTAVPLKGTLNVYGVLDGTGARPWLVCRLSPGFQLLNVKDPPLASPFSIAACSDGKDIGKLFYIGKYPANAYKLCWLDLAATSPTPKPIIGEASCSSTSYLGAAYGAIGSLPKTSYVVVQDNDSYLQLVPISGSTTHQISGQNPALSNTPIACVFLGNQLIVYYFNPKGTQGAPLMRTVVPSTDSFNTNSLTAASAPNGYTQLSAFIDPTSINSTSNGGISGNAIISYVQNGEDEIYHYTDFLQLP